MARKPPKIEHVKHVLRRGKWYSYFNTGTKDGQGRAIRSALPGWGTPGFWDSYAAYMAGRTKRTTAKTYTVADLAAEYLASAEHARKSPATRKVYGTYARSVTDTWGAYPVNDLMPSDVRLVIEGEQWGPAVRNMVLAVLGVMYRWGRKNGERAIVDPVRDLGRAKTGEHDPWPEDVLEAALKAEDATVRLAVHLLYFTGQRIGDVCAMRWGDIRHGFVYVKQGKTGKIVEPPLMTELAAELARAPRTGLLILDGMTPDRLRGKLQAFTKSLGVDTVPHGLRKNAVNALLEAGCTVAETMAITGQTMEVVEHYAAKVNRRKLGSAAVLKWDQARGTKG